MTEEEFDAAFGERLRAYAADRHAPADLENRLVQSIRGRVRRTRLGALGLVLLVLATCVAVVGLTDASDKTPDTATLVTGDRPRRDSTVTGWMFLGCIRECFRRTRNGRRREEDAVPEGSPDRASPRH